MLRTLIATALIIAANPQAFGQTEKTDEPTDLVQLRENWQRATQQATAPLNKKYGEALRAMKLRYTKEGNLDAAMAVDTEIKKLGGDTPTPPAGPGGGISGKQRAAIDQAVLGRWYTPKGGYGEFNKEGYWSMESKKSSYKIEKNGDVVLTDENQRSAKLTLSDDQKTLKGIWFDGSETKLTRRDP